MRDPIGEAPPGYVIHRVADTWLVFDQQATPDLVRMRFADPAVRESLFSRGPKRGRGAAPSVPVRPDLRVVLRRYRHGGLFGWLTGGLYAGTSRAVEELRVTAAAERLGAPVPHVMCVATWPILGPFWSAMIGTREETNARELLDVLRSIEDVGTRREILAEAGRAIRKLHDAGVDHKDLQLRNVLSVPEAAGRRIVVIDLDKADFHPSGTLSTSHRARNLGRLMRSVVKNGLWEDRVGAREVAVFFRAYVGNDRELRRELMGWTGRERIKLALHRIGYRLNPSTTRPTAGPLRPA